MHVVIFSQTSYLQLLLASSPVTFFSYHKNEQYLDFLCEVKGGQLAGKAYMLRETGYQSLNNAM